MKQFLLKKKLKVFLSSSILLASNKFLCCQATIWSFIFVFGFFFLFCFSFLCQKIDSLFWLLFITKEVVILHYSLSLSRALNRLFSLSVFGCSVYIPRDLNYSFSFSSNWFCFNRLEHFETKKINIYKDLEQKELYVGSISRLCSIFVSLFFRFFLFSLFLRLLRNQ